MLWMEYLRMWFGKSIIKHANLHKNVCQTPWYIAMQKIVYTNIVELNWFTTYRLLPLLLVVFLFQKIVFLFKMGISSDCMHIWIVHETGNDLHFCSNVNNTYVREYVCCSVLSNVNFTVNIPGVLSKLIYLC